MLVPTSSLMIKICWCVRVWWVWYMPAASSPPSTVPIGSMYGIFTYIWLIFMVNVAKYTIHGFYGVWVKFKKCTSSLRDELGWTRKYLRHAMDIMISSSYRIGHSFLMEHVTYPSMGWTSFQLYNFHHGSSNTLPKTNISPKNGGFQ